MHTRGLSSADVDFQPNTVTATPSEEIKTLFWILVQDIGGLTFAKQMVEIIEAKQQAYLATKPNNGDTK